MRLKLAFLALTICSCGSSARADNEFKYALGLQLSNQPEYPGSTTRKTKVSPVWAVHWGRVRFSTGGGNMLMGFGSTVYGPGASADLLKSARLRVGVSLRFDGGRSSGDAKSTQGLPDVRRTLRGRLFAGYKISEDVQLDGSLSQDLLGRGGGLIASGGLSWRFLHCPANEWSAFTGVSAGNATQMRSYFGVRPEDMQTSGLPVYQPGAGLKDIYAGVSYTQLLNKHWIFYATGGGSRLLGPAADSPLTVRPSAVQFAVSLAYRR